MTMQTTEFIHGGLADGLLDLSISDRPIPAGEAGEAVQIHINALPVELLGEIFMCYMDNALSVNLRSPRTMLFKLQRSAGLSSSPKRPHSPALLGCVCSHWRRITLSMPILWRDIWTAKPTAPDSASLFNLWLERSGSFPLDITILHIVTWNTVAQLKSLQRVPLDVISQSHRWRAIRLELHQDVEQALSMLQPTKMPLLEEFSADLDNWTDEGSLKLFEWVSSAAPNLRKVKFSWSCTREVLSAEMHWERLTHIALHTVVEWVDLHRVLARCSQSLQHLSLANVECSSSPAPTYVLSLPSLQSLELYRPLSFRHCYDALYTPSLIQLCLQLPGPNHSSDAVSPIVRLFERSNCHLQSLIWSGPRQESGGYMLPELLGHPLMQKLVHLNILTRATDRVLRALTHTSGLDPKPLPSLRTIVLRVCMSTDGVLSAMVLSRAEDSPTNELELVRAVLYAPTFAPNTTFAEDMSLKSKVPGMTVDISCASFRTAITEATWSLS